MKQTKTLLLFSTAALFFAGCGKFRFNEVKYTVTPSPLEYHGDSVAVTIKASYPAKAMPRRASGEITPVFRYNGGSVDFKTVTVKGDRSDVTGTTLSRSGGTFTYTDKVPYKDGMKVGELHVKATGRNRKGADKASVETKEPIALGTIITPLLILNDEKYVSSAHNFGPIFQTLAAKIYFPYNSFNIRPSERTSEDIKNLRSAITKYLNEQGTFENATFNGFASPEGETAYNANLSQRRADEVSKFISGEMSRLKVRVSDPKTFYVATGKGEDLDGFNKLIGGKDIDNKSEVMAIINSDNDPSSRERRLKAISLRTFQNVSAALEPLRRTEIAVRVRERQKTNDEIRNLALNDSKKLTANELLYAAEELVKDEAQKIQILRATQREFPEDFRAYNNLGVIHAKANRLSEALTEFMKAEKLAPNEAIVANNIGAVYFQQGNRTKAIEYYRIAKGKTGGAAGHNLGNYYIVTGRYSEAVAAFGNEQSFNAALAALLNGQPERVNSILSGAPSRDLAVADYLRAVAAARTKSKDAVISNLRNAIQKDSSWKAYAKDDLEFREYFKDSDFQNLVK